MLLSEGLEHQVLNDVTNTINYCIHLKCKIELEFQLNVRIYIEYYSNFPLLD